MAARHPVTGTTGWAWGAINSAVQSGAVTMREIVAAARAAQARTGTQPTASFLVDLTRMRSQAVKLRNAGAAFERANPEQLMSWEMLPLGVNARPSGDRQLLPEYKFTFDLHLLDEQGNPVTRTVSTIGDLLEGMTVQDALDAIGEAAEGLSREYQQDYVGFDNVIPEMI